MSLSLIGFIGRRCLQALPTIVLIAIINFLILHAAPGDIVDILAGEAGSATPEYMADLRSRFGLDQPTIVQLGRFLLRTLTLDLGYSFRHSMPVATLILDRLPATLLLMAISLVSAITIGILLGVLAARRVNRPTDSIISFVTILCYATPTFWVGLMMIVLFSVKLNWLPTGGMTTLSANLTGFARMLDIARHAILPATVLSLFYVAVYTRLMRASFLEVTGSDFVRTARAKGLPERAVTWRHVFRNALLPTVTIAGLQVGSILGGAVLVETVFGWPGLGRLAYEAVFQRDFNLLLGILVISSILVIVVNILVDLLYAKLDPRIDLRA